ncbi:TPA: hypothetical protein ACH3X1_005443 [Trebouxia sp. C0004]
MQAANRAVFVPLAPQGRYTGLGSATTQRFIPQPSVSKTVSDVHAESTSHSEPPCPLPSDNSRALMRTPYMGNGIMTAQVSHAFAVNSTQDDSDRAFRGNQASILSTQRSTHGGRPPRDASSRLLVRRGSASGVMRLGGAAVCPMVVIDAAGDNTPAQDAHQMSMLDCIAPRATEAAAALRLNQVQADQDTHEVHAGQLESEHGLFDEEEQQTEAEELLAVAEEQVMEGQAARGAPETVEGNPGEDQAAAQEGFAAEEDGGFSAAETPTREEVAEKAEALAALQAAHAEAEEEQEAAGAMQPLATVSGDQGQRGAPSTLDGTLTIQVPAAQQQQLLQCVLGAGPTGVGHVLPQTEVAARGCR